MFSKSWVYSNLNKNKAKKDWIENDGYNALGKNP